MVFHPRRRQAHFAQQRVVHNQDKHYGELPTPFAWGGDAGPDGEVVYQVSLGSWMNLFAWALLLWSRRGQERGRVSLSFLFMKAVSCCVSLGLPPLCVPSRIVSQALGFLSPASLQRTHAVDGGRTAEEAARGTRPAAGTALSMNTQNGPAALEMTPRRKQFFRMVSEGLKVGFEGEDLSRVEKFVRYCKGELAYEPLGPLHQVGSRRRVTGTGLEVV